MSTYTDYVFGETTTSLLQMHLALYHQSKNQLRIEHPMVLEAVEATIPRVKLELGFLDGIVSPISSALNVNKSMPPYNPGHAIILALNKKGHKLCALELFFSGKKEQIDWKEWRLEAIANGEFEEESFPPYDSVKIKSQNKKLATIYSNESLELGSKETKLGTSLIELTIHHLEELNPKNNFRYAHAAEFKKKLTDQEQALITGIDKAQYL